MGARNAQEKDAADLSGVQRLPLKIALAIRGFLYFHTNLEIYFVHMSYHTHTLKSSLLKDKVTSEKLRKKAQSTLWHKHETWI